MARNMYTVSHGKLQCSKMTEVYNSVVVERTNHKFLTSWCGRQTRSTVIHQHHMLC